MTRNYLLVLSVFITLLCQPFNGIGQIAALDQGFVIQGSGFDDFVYAVATQSDSKILVGGKFNSYGSTSVKRLVRLNLDGSVDATFNIGSGFNGDVKDIALDANGKILVVGSFTQFNGNAAGGIVRLLTDGTLDASFVTQTGFNGTAEVVVVKSDGTIMVGGSFTMYSTQTTGQLVRLLDNGTRDTNFNIGSGFGISSVVQAIAIQPDGKILVGGEFTAVNSISAKRIVRLLSNGTVDSTFITGSGCNATVYAIAVQTDGKVLLGGAFTNYNGTSAGHLARLNTSGTADMTFMSLATVDDEVYAIRLYTDGRILVAGKFVSATGAVYRNYLARFAAEGSLDLTFETSAGLGNTVHDIAMLDDGRIVVGGEFQTFSDDNIPYVAVLLDHLIEMQSSMPMGPWCAGPSIQFIYTVTGTFNASNVFTAQLSDANGNFTTPVDIGIMPGQMGGALYASIPISTPSGVNYTIRIVSSDPYSVSQDPLELFVNQEITSAPHSASIGASPSGVVCEGTDVTFNVTSINSGTASYIWYRNGTAIGGNSSSYTDNILQTGDLVWCEVTSTEACAFPQIVNSDTISMTVTPNEIPSASISAFPNGQVCAGTSVFFTAAPVNAGSTPSYQWTLNGTNVGSNTGSYVNSSLADADVVQCIVTSSAVCADPITANSNSITVDILSPVVPSISIVADLTTICEGSTVNFTASPVNQGAAPTYIWKVNGVTEGTNSSVFSSDMLVDGDVITCTLTNNDACANNSPVVSNSVPMVVVPNLTPAVSIVDNPSGPICSGTLVQFTATATDAGPGVTYFWEVNDLSVGTNSASYSSSTLADGDVVVCIVESSESCVTSSTGISDPIFVSVTNTVIPSVSIVSDQGSTICDGSTVTFTASPTNGGSTPIYEWLVNGSVVGSNLSTFISSTLMDGDMVECKLTSNEVCASPSFASSNTITMTVVSNLTPAVSISDSPSGQVCVGTLVQFTATATDAGPGVAYFWEVNNASVGSNSPTFSSSTLADGDVVSCSIESAEACVTSSTAVSSPITVSVVDVVIPSVSILSDQGTAICEGASVIFTATPVNPGASPTYSWTVNGIDAGETTASFSTSTLMSGDEVICTLTNNDACASPSTVSSNAIVMTVSPNHTPSVSISANPSGQICAGTDVTFTAVATDAGTGPSYAWTRNGSPVGANADSYSSSVLADDDIIICTVTSSDVCVTSLTDVSDPITMDVLPVITPTVFILSDLGTTICANAEVTFSAVVANEGSAPTYAWQVDGVDMGISTDTYTTNTLADGATVKCVLTNTDACASPASVTSTSLVMAVVGAPAAPAEILGNTVLCAEDVESFSVADVAGATAYSWTLPPGWVGSSSSNSITPNIGSTGGVISVTADNGCGSSSAQTLDINVNPNYSTYSGTVTVGGINVSSGWVYTLKQQISGVGWEKADSAQIVNGTYLFAELPIYGVPFILKAVAPCQDCVPSYYALESMSHQWDSTGLSYSLFSDCGGIHVKNIEMVTTEGVLDGICTISGTVFWATGKQAATDPIPLIDVVVEKVPPGNAFTYGQTDAEGNGTYSFENMPVLQGILERYRIYISVPGIPMADTYFVDVNPNDTSITNLDFYIDLDDTLIYIQNPNGLHEPLAVVEDIRLMPNPMHDRMTVILPARFGMASTYRMLGIDGKVVDERAVNGTGPITIERGTLPSGIYFIEVTNTDGLRRTAKVVVQ
jgi:uncharacterized delta-60 repeat protein